jgi:hypothetical protein
MAEEKDKWMEFVYRLEELTRDGTLQWTPKRPPEILRKDPNRLVSIVFETEYKDQQLRLYEEKVNTGRGIIDPFAALIGKENSSWRDYIVLELVNKNGAVWEFPEIWGVRDLLESVKYHVTGVNEYIEAVLADETAKSR